MDHFGALICRERLRRNWSQEGLCKGICTVSYLSKIEKGRAEPSPEIRKLLLERLELSTDDRLEQEAAELAARSYELLFSGRGPEMEGLEAWETWRATGAGLDLLLLAQFADPAGTPLEPGLEAVMTPRQLALQRILQHRQAEAVRLLPCAYTHMAAGFAAYHAGSYAAAIEQLHTAYDLAAGEGAPHLMLQCKLLIGNSYCNGQDTVNMEKHYTVARRLAAALGEEGALRSIDYNTAAVHIELGHYEEAYRYFSSLEEPDLMSLHKLAICCEKTGRREQALAALDRAGNMESEVPDTPLARKMCALVRYRLEHPNYLEGESYGGLLMDCFARCRRELPPGYAVFHLPWVLEWLAATRQYKQAYELMRGFPEKQS